MSFSRGASSTSTNHLRHKRLSITSIPVFSLPAFLLITSIVTDWGYSNIKADGECLTSWAANNDLSFLLNPKGNSIFHFGRWKYETNLDLTFVKTETT